MNYDFINDKFNHPTSNILFLSNISLHLVLSYHLANKYLASIISTISQNMKWCSDVSGLLLLNIVNGIPDLMTSLVLIDQEPSIIVQTCLGSFVTTLMLCLPLVIIYSKKTNYLEFSTFYKNLFGLIFSFCFYIYLIALQSFNYTLPVFMLLSYVVFVAYSICYSDTYSDSIEIALQEDQGEKSSFSKWISTFLIPISVILETCVLNYNYDSLLQKNVYYALISPPMNFMLAYIYLDLHLSFRGFWAAVLACFVVGVALCISIRNNAYKMLCYAYSFAMCCMLSYFFTNEVVKYIEFLNNNKTISLRFSSMTFLSLSNCLGDLIAGVASSKNGLFKTAANACLTAPIHSTLFNLSLTFLVMLYRNNAASITIGYDTIINVALGLGPFIFINLILNYEIRNRKLMSELACVLLFIYTLYWCFTMMQTIN